MEKDVLEESESICKLIPIFCNLFRESSDGELLIAVCLSGSKEGA